MVVAVIVIATAIKNKEKRTSDEENGYNLGKNKRTVNNKNGRSKSTTTIDRAAYERSNGRFDRGREE